MTLRTSFLYIFVVAVIALFLPCSAEAAERDFSLRYTVNTNGDIKLIGNTGMTCSACAFQNGSGDNDAVNMVYANGVGTSTTLQSTAADLSMAGGSTVLWAGLYWQGDSNAAGRYTVTLQTPSGTSAVTASQQDSTTGGCPSTAGGCNGVATDRYSGFADVTSLVQSGGTGTYTVSGILGSPNNINTYAGWGLVVVYQNAALNFRNLSVFDGFKSITNATGITIPISGFLTPYTGPVNTTLGFIAGEGDLTKAGENLPLNGINLSDAIRTTNNIFMSSITDMGSYVTAKSPNYSNQLGWDIGRIAANNVLNNGATSASIRLVTTSGTPDYYYPAAITFATDVYVPVITPNVVKTASDVNGGYLLPGETLRFAISLGNTGYDTATNVSLSDNIPAWTTYKPNSLQILSGANTGAKSDIAADDQAEYIATGTPRVVFRLGTGANGTTGGTLMQNQFTSISFDVTVDANIPAGTTITNTAGITNNGQTLSGTSYSSATNPVQVIVLTPPTVSKSFSPNPVDINGVSTMTIQMVNPSTNAATLTGVSFNDTYPAGMINDSNPMPTISCTAGSIPGNIVGGVAGAASIGMNGATIAQNGSCTVTVRIKSSLPQLGNYLNNTGAIVTSNAGNGTGVSATFSVGGPTIAKSFTPAVIVQGDSSTITFTLSNPTDVALTLTSFSDSMPPNMQVASGAAANSCGGSLSAAVGSSTISLSNGTLPKVSQGGTCTITVPVTTTAAGYYTNSTSGVTSLQTPVAGPGSNSVTLTAIAKATATKAFSVPSITVSGVAQLSITVTNPNSSNPLNNTTITGLQFTDTYPANLVNSTSPSPLVTCTAGSSAILTAGTGTAGGNSIGINSGSLAPGGSCTVTVNVRSGTTGTYNNSTGNITTTNAGTASPVTASLLVSALAPPTVNKTFTTTYSATAPGSIQVGQTSTMTITLTNPNVSPNSVTGIAFTDNYPTGMTNTAAATATTCGGTVTTTAGGSSLTFAGGSIAGGGSCTITATVTTASAGAYTNIIPTVITANAGTALQGDGTLYVMGPPVITKSLSPNAVPTATYSTMTIIVSNPGSNPLPLYGVTFTDSYPAGMINNSTTGRTQTCTAGSTFGARIGGTTTAPNNTFGLSGTTILPGGSCTSVIRVSAAAAGTYTNSISNSIPGNVQVTATNGGTGNVATDVLSVGNIGISKSFAAATPIPSGGATTMTIALTNGTGAAVTAAAFTDNYPPGLTNAAAGVLVSNSCGGAVTAAVNGSLLSLVGGSIPTGGCAIVLNVTATATATNSIPVGALTGSGGRSNQEAATATLSVYPVPTAIKSFTPSSIAYNQASLPTASLMTITLYNTNNFAASGVAFTDSYPGGLVNTAAPAPNSTCGGTVTATANGNSLTLTGGTIPTNGSCTVTVNVTSNSAGSYPNTTGAVTTTNAGQATPAAATLTVLQPITVSKGFSPAIIGTNGTSRLTITLTNPNSVAVSGVALNDTYPSLNLVNTASPGASTSCSGGTATAAANGNSLSLATAIVPPGGSCSVSVDVNSAAVGSYVNATGVVTTTNASSAAPAGATLTVTLPAPVVSKSFTPSQMTVNATSLLTVTISNPNATPFTGVAFTDSYPSGITNSSAPAAGSTNCGSPAITAVPASGTSLAVTGATIAAGATCTITVNVTSATAGGYTNTINSVTSSNGGTGGPASAPLIVVLPAPTALKAFTPLAIAPGATSLMTITLNNANATPISGAAFFDSYPPGLANTATPNATTTCSGGTVSAANNGTTLNLSGATIPAGGSCTVTVNVTSSTTGAYLNSTGQISSTNAALGTAASATLTVSNSTLNKTFTPATIVSGQSSILAFTISNGSNNPAQSGLAFTDTLPTNVLLSGTATAAQCGGLLSYDTSATPHKINFTGGALPFGTAGCTINTTVTSSVTGSYPNTKAANISNLAGSLNADSVNATLTVIPPATLSKAFSAAGIVSGQTSTLTFTITNGSGNPAQAALGFTDTLPTNVLLFGTATASQCGGTLSYDTSTTPHRINFTGGTLAATTPSCAITATVTGSTPGAYTNAAANISNLAGGLTAPGITATLTVIPAATLTKGFAPATINAFANSTLTFTITNGSGNPAQTDLAFTDTLPTNLVLAAVPTASQCNGTVSGSIGSGIISFSGGTLGIASCTITATVTSSIPGSYTNNSSNITGAGGGLVTGSVTATLAVQAPSPSLSKAFTAATIVAGQTSTLSFTINNGTGNLAQSGLAFSDTLPAGLSLSGSATASQCGGTVAYDTASIPNKINFSGGSLANGQAACSITTTVTSATAGSYVNNSARISNLGGNLDATGVNATLTVIPPTTLAKGFTPATLVTGQTSTLTFTIANGSGNPAQTGLAFIDTLPANVLLSGTANSSQCGGTVTYDISGSPHRILFSNGSLAASSGSCNITATVTGNIAGSYTNAAANITALAGGLTDPGITATLTVIPHAGLSKSFAPATIGSGQASTLTFKISNGSGNPAQSGLGFTDTLQSGLTLSGTATSPQCGGTVSYSGGNTITFSGGSLAVGAANCSITASVTSSVAGSYGNGAGDMSALAGGLLNNVTNQTLTVVATSLSKAFLPATIGIGQTSTLRFIVSNGSGNPAQGGLGFSDTLPAGVTLSGVATASQCGGTLSYIGTNVISFTGGSLALTAGSCTVTATVTSIAAGSYTNDSTNIAALTGGVVNSVTSQTLTVVGTTLTKGIAPATIVAGQTATLTFSINNSGTNPAQAGLTFTDTLPFGVTLSGTATTPQCGGTVSYSGGNTITLTGGSLGSGVGSCNITATVTAASAGGYLNNSANISGLGGGLTAPGLSALLTVNPAAALSKTFSPAIIPSGATSTLTFTITNGSGNPAQSSLDFTDTLPAGLSLSGVATAGQCGGNLLYDTVSVPNRIIFTSGSLALSTSSCTITATVTTAAGGVYSNTSANISALNGGLTATGVNASLTVSTGSPNLSKAFSPSTIGVGQLSTLSFSITNGSSTAQSGLGFTDILPSGVTLSGSAVSPQCGGTVSYSGGNTVTFSGGSLAIGANCSITTTVTSSAPGPYTNNSANIPSSSGSPTKLVVSGVNATLNVSGTNLTKTFAPLYIGIGQTSALTFTITNGSGFPAQSGLAFTDTLSSGLTLSGTPSTPQCGGTVAYGGAGNNILTFSGGSLISSTTACNIIATVTSAAAASYPNNSGNISGLSTGLTYSGSTNLTVLATPTVTKTFGATSIPAGGTTTLALTLGNPAANTASITSLQLDDTFPAGLILRNTAFTFNPASCGNVTNTSGGAPLVSDNNIRLTVASIAPGASCQLTMNVTSSTAGSIINTTNTPTATGPIVLTGATANAPLSVYDLPLLSVLKSANRATASPGEVIVYNVQIVNTGSGVGTSVVLTDELSPYGSFYLGGGSPFSFTDSSPVSGLSLSAPQYSNNNGTTWLYPPVSGGGGAPAGYDGNVTNWRIPMVGTIRAGGSFILNYQVIVK